MNTSGVVRAAQRDVDKLSVSYRRIAESLEEDRCPFCRELAGDLLLLLAEELRINRNTVAKAYAELQQEGIVEAVQGRGVFVTDNHSPLKKEVRQKLLAELIDGALVQAHHFQIDDDEFRQLVRNRMERLASQRRKP